MLMLRVAGACVRGIGLAWLCTLLACSSYDPGLLQARKPGHDAGTGSGSTADHDASLRDAGDSAVVDAAHGGGGSGGSGGSTEPTGACHPNPNTLDEVCPQICPEKCNGKDDDCDRQIDEDPAAQSCAQPHTTELCAAGGVCVVTQCTDGYRDCNGKAGDGCEIAPDDPNNCGQCGKACSVQNGTATCSQGKCVVSACDKGWADCDADPTSCETRTDTLADCGGCNTICKNVPNASASCSSGSCGVDSCNAGYGNCDQTPNNGCEQELNTLANCGACGKTCSLSGTQASCQNSAQLCMATGCDVGYDDCDKDLLNGCESLKSPNNCGQCGKVCMISALQHVTSADCATGGCVIQCESRWGDCDADPQTGCETSLDSLSHCGSCAACPVLANAVSACVTGACTLAKCNDGYGDCTGGAADGCETSLDSKSDCGGCGTPCTKASCSGGICSAIDCTTMPGFGDCDGDGASCETNLTTDLNNCGACANKCAFDANVTTPSATLTCSAQGCQAACSAGFGDCDGNYKNGCETALDTLTNCGSCGHGCAIANAAASCATSSCAVATCNTDYADCDADKKSCETALNTPSHCGGCTNGCNLSNAVSGCGGSPGARVCAVIGCSQTYYKNCDGSAANGCEIDSRGDVKNCGACGTDCGALANVSSVSCVSSACSIGSCKPGYGDCTASAGCETSLSTVQNCGACAMNCDSALSNTATTSCDASTLSCKIGTCKAGFADCDATQSTGCETSIFAVQNCGGCASLGQNTPCTNLPNAVGACAAGGCSIGACNANFADCDGNVQNGCERDVRAVSAGGQGPCVPDTNCTKFSGAGHDYFLCTTARSWADARTHCQQQQYGDLVQVADATEKSLVGGHLTALAWIGANDLLVKGLWQWANNGVPFWKGTNTGVAQNGQYNNWASGEPNGSGDCAQMYTGSTAGQLDDTVCTATKPFVCELSPDACPSDPAKYDPGQCGCGSPDTDADKDGFAVCKDACDNDPNKLAAGLCGCGVADTDTDADGTPDCHDACPNDSKKIAVGVCGCSVADTDTDGDGFADCIDNCPADKNKQDPGLCGCGTLDTDTDKDGTPDCHDGCPADPTKVAAGQCGCGVADTDTDGDGTADCNDACPNNAPKTAPGVCGCAVADTDTDGDGTPDCNDACPNNAPKVAPGVCGCATADYDTDGDGTPNCNDSCPFDASNAASCFGYAPANSVPQQSFASSPTWNCSAAGTTTVDSAAGTVTSTSCTLGTLDVTNNVPQYQPGLFYGKIVGAWDTTTPNPANLAFDPLGPSISELNTELGTGSNERWVDGTTYVYSGEIYITASGVASFMEHIDDNVYLKIDSTVVLNDASWTQRSAGKFVGSQGWHSFELRLYDGIGGQGPSSYPPTGLPGVGYAPVDMGLSTTFSDYSWPHNLDASTPSLFRAATSGPNVMVVRLKGLTVSSNHVLKLTGDKPIVVLVSGNVLVDSGGKIDASATNTTAGPGGNLASQCSGATGGDGRAATSASDDSDGGGGGAFGTAGGRGGRGNGRTSGGGTAGAVSADTDLQPLRGGCAGGRGGNSNNAAAGGGGGAFQLSASGTITIGTGTNTGYLIASGGAGKGQPMNNNCEGDGGDGGGSGGGILLQASVPASFGSNGVARVHGGGAGGATECNTSTAGQAGHSADDSAANGGTGDGSAGGKGGLCRGLGCTTAATGLVGGDTALGAGGGGGGGGRIVGASAPPAPSSGCTFRAYGGHGYYFCSNASAWSAARDLCRATTAKMQLARIDSSAENAFVATNLSGITWIGANDRTTEGTWRWSELSTDDGPPYWSGKSSSSAGTAVGGLYNSWNAGEPNDAGSNEDCGEMNGTVWNDNNCANAQGFVCEYTP
ncbi:MAG TPA: C-type lectin domain-containing protein [Polyangiales bacterium]